MASTESVPVNVSLGDDRYHLKHTVHVFRPDTFRCGRGRWLDVTVYNTWGGVIQSPVEWNNEHAGLNPEVIVGLLVLT